MLLGLLIVGAAAIAQQAMDADGSWLDEVEQGILQTDAGVSAASFSGVPDQAPVSLAGTLPTHDASVGRIAGDGGVSGGAATYTIPIVIPPGRRGVQPDLALSYNSRSGNGIAGMGWSLSGLSSIGRCPSTLEQDGQVQAVDLSNSDKLCLDGQRLVLTSGTYGQAGAIYATEIESFSRIKQISGAISSASTYFQVETKSGDILYYGGNSTASSTARVIPGGASAPMNWMLERRLDRTGNMMRYAYTSYGNGENLLSSVAYTGFNTSDGDRKVEFTYETRPATGTDQTSSYIAGGLLRQSQRLTRVTTKVGAQAVREYRLAYITSAASSRSLLASVTECAYVSTTASCRRPTVFTWQQRTPTFAFKPMSFEAGASPLVPGRITSMKQGGDFNGDGTADYVVTQRNTSGAIETYLATFTPGRTVRAAMLMSTGSIADYERNVDFDLDGRADVLGWDASGNLQVRFWHGPIDATTAAAAFTDTWATGINLPVSGANAAEVSFAGDMDADGRADILVTRNTPAGPTSCKISIEFYKNTPSGAGGTSPSTFPLTTTYCLAQTGVFGFPAFPVYESLHGVRDFNGDGLMDLLIYTMPPTNDLKSNPARVAYGQRTSTLSFSDRAYATLFPASDPIQPMEADGWTYSMWTDVNGDGLDDLLWGKAGAGGYWTLRFNTGTGLGARVVFNTNVGIEHCAGEGDSQPDWAGRTYCAKSGYAPWHSAQITFADTDGDGRSEILIPRQFAQQSCVPVYADPNQCGDPLRANSLLDTSDSETPERMEALSGPIECQEVRYMCAENPLTGNTGLGAGFITYDNGDSARAYGMYNNGYGRFDQSQYYMDALRVRETGAGTYTLSQVSTGLIGGGGRPGEDMYGDGLTDVIVTPGCGMTRFYECAGPVADSNGTPYPPSQVPQQYPGGYSFYVPKLYLNENLGASASLNPDGRTPQLPDMLGMVTDGLGAQTSWTYYPLGSKAGRVAGETPLYTVPAGTSGRYIDDRHYYFTSSMPVVAEMTRSDGIGDYRSWRYGYSEAIYHARGRGFQGFRTIIEEDEGAGTRTTTTFNQKFPLTSQPDSIIVSSLKRPGTDGLISKQVYRWRCNRADRNDATACVPPSGTATVKFPYLAMQETWSYDAAMADDPGAGVPVQLSYKSEVAADDASCNGALATASAYDAYGNLTASSTVVTDGTGTGGYRSFVAAQRTCIRTTFAAADTTNWWLDKISSRTVTSTVAYNATNHPLPAGVANPTQTVVTQYTWNANRTPATETVQPGVANQQRVTTYGYPSPSYGLPGSVTVNASGDANGNRVTTTSYSSDGYFPQTVTNPLGHAATVTARKEDGQPSLITDANGLRTITTYDAFGFATKVQYRGVTDGEYVAPDKLASLSWCGSCLAPGKYRRVTVQDGSSSEFVYFDLLGRSVGSARALADATWSYQAIHYDAAGHVSAQSEPFRSNQATIEWTLFTDYDVLGRLKEKVVPQGNADGRGDRVTSYTYTGRTTGIQVCGSQDPDTSKCLNLSRTTDSLGRYVETVDANGGVTKFWYDGNGNSLALKDAKGSVISAAYNALGQRTSANDPNQGVWSFAYDALGEVLSQTDARGIVSSMQYDKLGRPTQSSASYAYDDIAGTDTITDTWTYDPAYGKGKEATRTRTLNTTTVLRQVTTTYDLLSRPAAVQYDQIGVATPIVQETAYDMYYGRPKAQSFGNGEAVWLRYSSFGHLTRESDANGTNTDYRVVNTVDARGNPTQETLAGGNVSAVRGYQAETGQPTRITYSKVGGAELRRLDYKYDVFGNLSEQALNTNQTVEDYSYDVLHRLTEATRVGAASGTVDYAYDAVGNFTSKSDFSSTAANAYTYTGGTCGGGPNAVKSVALKTGGSRTYCYDANGNLTSDSAGLAITYDHTQRPIKIARGAVISRFDYDSTGERIRQTGIEGIQYYPGIERRFGAGTVDKTYAGTAAVVTTSGATRSVQYLLTDRLGSVDAIADASGNLVETRGYDAFGKPRTGTWADATRLASTSNTPHGFTGHEHLNQLELIHMNGRVYDYTLGRFTGVDPVIQFPLNSQSLNPYSYILNNPLSATDPTGYTSTKCSEVPLGGAGSGTCQEIVDDKRTTINYTKKDGVLTISASGAGARAFENAAAALSGASKQGGIGGGRQERDSRADAKGSSANGAVSGADAPVPLYSQPRTSEPHEIDLASGGSRGLTKGEKEMARSVFGDDLDYDKPRIFRKKAYFFQPNDRAMTPDGNIYFHPDDQGYHDDFSNSDIYSQHTFIHEMTHVWQNQQGINVRTAAFNRSYDYWPLQSGKKFGDYGLEQQAQMTSDYFMLQSSGRIWTSLKPRPTAQDYEQVIPFRYKP
ncbi:SpvB/TcaC N-terminal domain-containing protein [Lysobacter yangpyeongensis]|uniref:SpvB/TcaC N-terminal domain-containing protein n=1 Tax=Lysobacter yangpyeongensis TaxID=346182 RepID=A0ABW0SKF4_9GAMM